ncbi:hypothetical protein H2200_013262 [Cladophialophora chaetospira]|uniref:CWH43-like N-terminal domain-containing protein n=1 Tax=Cladophialophora chaetospira TaxID=386627 RepID=A0AA38WQ30_9EURO|nr:hypothetical protein H2200_013262 [Cladophialophora chaetospira]
MSQLQRQPTAQRHSYYSIEGSVFLDDYGPERVRTNSFDEEKIDGLFRRRKTNWAEFQRRAQPKIRPWTPALEYFWDHRYSLRAVIPILAALLELFLLLFLFCTYYTLPADPVTGEKPPRVSDRYANFPFISCVGSQRLALYQGLTFAIVILSVTSTAITFYFCRDDLLGWHTRRAGLLASVSGAGLNIWLVFAAAVPDQHLHLTVTGAKAVVVFGIKTTGMLIDHYDRSKYPALRQAGVIKVMMWWRIITLVVAFPLAVMTNVAIFSCNHANPKEFQTPGTKCYRIMTLGAPAEWFYAITTVSWSLTIAFDIYITPIISKVKSAQDEADFQLLASEHDGSSHDAASPEFMAPGKDEESESSRSSMNEGEKDRRWNSAYDKLDVEVRRGREGDDYPYEIDGDEELDLGMQARLRDWA